MNSSGSGVAPSCKPWLCLWIETLHHPHGQRVVDSTSSKTFPFSRGGWWALSSSVFSAWAQKLSKQSKGKSLSELLLVASFENMIWGKKTWAVSTSFFKVLGCLHGTAIGKPVGKPMPLQKFAIKSLWTLPGWTPWEPHLAIATSSWCSAPSKVTHSASHLMVVPGSLPMAPKGQQCCCQGSAVTFFKVFIQNSQLLFKLPNPEPFSNCFFKPYLALPWNATLLEGVLFSRKTLFQGNTFFEEIFSAMARKSFFKVGHKESLCICIPSYGL